MADRYSFQSPFSRGASSNPWFMAGPVAVTTTAFVVGLSLLGLFLFVAEGGIGTLGGALLLDERALNRGQLWRLATHIIPLPGIFGGVLSMIFFYMIGSQFEGQLGRRAYTSLIVVLTIVPALFGAITALATNQVVIAAGLGMMFFGMAAAFAAANVQAKSFFGIPFWGLIAFFFVLQVLSMLSQRDVVGLVMLFTTCAIGLIVTRSLGFSNVEWIPSVRLPSFFTEGPQPRPASTGRTKTKSKKKRKSAGHLQAVPTATASEAEIDALLDQVSDLGIDSLTKQQKQTLERHSKEMRKRRDG